MATQYNHTCDVGKEREEWLWAHPERRFVDIVREAIDREMEKVI